ncbi:MAG TPA: hypothetical protein VGK73_32945, partial [Polyangiaceae bacterium]
THPDFRPCLSAGRGLHVRAPPRADVELELVAPIAGEYDIYLGWLADPNTELRVSVAENAIVVTHGPRGCERTKLGTFHLPEVTRTRLEAGRTLLVDYLDLARVDSKKR